MKGILLCEMIIKPESILKCAMQMLTLETFDKKST